MIARCGGCKAQFETPDPTGSQPFIDAECPSCGHSNRYSYSIHPHMFDRPAQLIESEAPLGRPNPDKPMPFQTPIDPPAPNTHTVELPNIKTETITDGDSQVLPDPPPVSEDPPYEPPPKEQPLMHMRSKSFYNDGRTPPPEDFVQDETLSEESNNDSPAQDSNWFDPDEPYPPPSDEESQERPPEDPGFESHSYAEPDEASIFNEQEEENDAPLFLETEPSPGSWGADEEEPPSPLEDEPQIKATASPPAEPIEDAPIPWRPYCFWGAVAGCLTGIFFGLIEIRLATAHTLPGKPVLSLLGEAGFFASVGWLLGLIRSRREDAWDYYPGMILAGVVSVGLAIALSIFAGLAHFNEQPDFLSSSAGIVFRRGFIGLIASAPFLFLYLRLQRGYGDLRFNRSGWIKAVTLSAFIGLGLELTIIDGRIRNSQPDPAGMKRMEVFPALLSRAEDRPEPTKTTSLVAVIASEVAAPLEKYPDDLIFRFKTQNRSGAKTFWVIKASVFDPDGNRLAWRLMVNGIMKWTESDFDEIGFRREAFIPPHSDRLRTGEIRRASFIFFGLRSQYHHYTIEAIEYDHYLRVIGGIEED